MDTLTVVLSKSTVGTTDVMSWIDTYGFPTNYHYLVIINEDKSEEVTVTKNDISYEQSALINCIDLGIIVPWQSDIFPGWKRVFDKCGWTLIKDTTMYYVTHERLF